MGLVYRDSISFWHTIGLPCPNCLWSHASLAFSNGMLIHSINLREEALGICKLYYFIFPSGLETNSAPNCDCHVIQCPKVSPQVT